MRALLAILTLIAALAFLASLAGCSADYLTEPERDPTCTYYKNGDAYCPL